MNAAFMEMLRESPLYQDGQLTRTWSLGKVAQKISENLCRVIDVLNNKPGHSPRIRLKLARFIRRTFPMWCGMLAALNWDECGRLLAREKPDPQEEFQFVRPNFRHYTAALDARMAEKIPLTPKAPRFRVTPYSRWVA